MKICKLVDQPRLAHTCLAHNGDDLTAADTRLAGDPAEVLDLGVAADEAREAAESRRLQSCPRRPRAGQFEELDWLHNSLHGNGPEGPHLDVPLSESHGLAGQPDSSKR